MQSEADNSSIMASNLDTVNEMAEDSKMQQSDETISDKFFNTHIGDMLMSPGSEEFLE